MADAAHINTAANPKLAFLSVRLITNKDARAIVVRQHYMKTWPQGAKISFGVFYNGRCDGVLVFGKSTGTRARVEKVARGLDDDQFIEMQRMWIRDNLGHNTESFVLAQVMKLLKAQTNLRLVITHAGGCKNDCGIVYQSSAWLYFGAEKCDDFYLTDAGQYRNIIAAMRFGRVTAAGKTNQEIGHELFGPGAIVDAWRYHYAYPLDKGLRRKLQSLTMPYPKTSADYRFNQEWIKGAGEGRSEIQSTGLALGSNPDGSTIHD